MTISKKTVLLSLALLALIGAGLAAANKLWLLGALAAAVVYGGYKIRKILYQYFGKPKGRTLLKADVSDLVGETLGHYYVQAGGENAAAVAQGIYCAPPFDAHGIPLADYGAGIGPQYNPVVVAEYALECWELFLRTNAPYHRASFFKQADWLVEYQTDGRWYYRFEFPGHGLKSPWISGLAQGLGVSVLLRAWQCSGEVKYRDAAERAFALFEVPIDRSGVSLKAETGTWFEEYPNPAAPDHVLNGHIWALFGIWDMYRATRSPVAQRLFQEGIGVLKAELGRYDTGFWVWYDLRPRSFLVDADYMVFQIEQMRVLAALTEDSMFAGCLTRWEAYRRSVRSRWLVLGYALKSRLCQPA